MKIKYTQPFLQEQNQNPFHKREQKNIETEKENKIQWAKLKSIKLCVQKNVSFLCGNVPFSK